MNINIKRLIDWENRLFETLFALKTGNVPPPVDLNLMGSDTRARYLRFQELVSQGGLATQQVKVGLIGTYVAEMGRALEGERPRDVNPELVRLAREVDPEFRPNRIILRELDKGLKVYSQATGDMLHQQVLFNYDEVAKLQGDEFAYRAFQATQRGASPAILRSKRLDWGRFINAGSETWGTMMGEAEVPVLERVSQRRLFPRLFAGVLGSAFLFCVGNFLYGIYQHKKSDELATNFIFDLGDSFAKTPAQIALVTGARYLIG